MRSAPASRRPVHRAPSIFIFIKIYISVKSLLPRKSLLFRAIIVFTQLSVSINGIKYTNWDTYRKIISDWSILAKFSFIISIKNKDRATYACVVDDYTWKYYARRGKNNIIKFRITNNEHTCDGAAENKRKTLSIKDFLDKIIF
jgi:hypothetical protein